MSKYKYEGYGVIRDTEMDFPYHTDDIAELLEEQDQQITDLQSQLAGKEKEIKTILKENEELVIKYNVYNWGDKIQKDKVYSLTGEALELLINRQNQKAIEQLEKVKEKLNDYDIQDILSSSSDPYGEFDENCVTTEKINETIDQQINELKGKVEDE